MFHLLVLTFDHVSQLPLQLSISGEWKEDDSTTVNIPMQLIRCFGLLRFNVVEPSFALMSNAVPHPRPPMSVLVSSSSCLRFPAQAWSVLVLVLVLASFPQYPSMRSTEIISRSVSVSAPSSPVRFAVSRTNMDTQCIKGNTLNNACYIFAVVRGRFRV